MDTVVIPNLFYTLVVEAVGMVVRTAIRLQKTGEKHMGLLAEMLHNFLHKMAHQQMKIQVVVAAVLPM